MSMLKGMLCVFAIAAAVGFKQGLAADKPQGTPYSISLANLECVNTSSCGVAIPAVPAGKVLAIEHITGFAQTNQDAPFLRVLLTASATPGPSTQTTHHFVMNRVAALGIPSVSYNVNIPMLAFVMPGAQNAGLLVELSSGGSAIIQMTITGYLMDL